MTKGEGVYILLFMKTLCSCGSKLESGWIFDARNIPLCRVCPECKKNKLAKYRRDVLINSNYECDELIDAE